MDMIHAFDDRALLGDEMGLGKTLTAITAAVEIQAFPTLVVCPAPLKRMWAEQIKEHLGMGSRILSSRTPTSTKTLSQEKFLIINYDILGSWLDTLQRAKTKLIIADEVHYAGNLNSQRCRNFMALCENKKKIIAISGTPLVNRPFELFPILHILLPDRFPSPFVFGHTYCNARREFGSWKFDGARNLSALHKKLKKLCLIRRTSHDVRNELPPLMRSVVALDIEKVKEYERAEKDFISWLAETDLRAAMRAAKAERYTRFTGLKRLAARLKHRAVLGWLDSYLEESEGKIIVGFIHRDLIAETAKRYKDVCTVIHGGKTPKQREEAENKFRKDSKCRMLVGQVKAMGVGLNLPEATDVALAELPWNPGTCLQLEGRARRITTTHPVNAWYLIGHGTVEERVCDIIQSKQSNLDMVLDGKKGTEDSIDIFDQLQKEMVGKC